MGLKYCTIISCQKFGLGMKKESIFYKQYCDELISIFPFEQKYFEAKNIQVYMYFGNPLKDIYEKKGEDINLQHQEDVHAIALVTRKQKARNKKTYCPFF
jgi:lipid A disaccharide synthetase